MEIGPFSRALRAFGRPIEQVRALRAEDQGRLAPSPPVASPITGHLPFFQKDRLGYTLEIAQREGDVVRLRFGWITGHVVSHPDAVRHVLVDNQKNYDKQTPGFDNLRVILGNGLVTSEGAFWRRQRRIAQPAFQKEKVNAFAGTMSRCTEEMCDRWLASGAPFDAHDEMMKVTLRIAGLTLLSTDFTGESRTVGDAVSYLLHEANARIAQLFDFDRALPTTRGKRLRSAIGELDRVVEAAIADRRARPRESSDLLSLLMSARDEETGEAMDATQLRDEVLTAFLAGHETTANALTWSLYLASLHPAAANAVVEETKRIAGSAPIDAATAMQLGAAKRFVSEAMRLYPPAWMIGRRAIDRDEIGGFPIPKDSIVFVSPWVTHRRGDVFENPEGFDPDRFLPERIDRVPRYAYFPFGAGPRICIGQGFAMLEAVMGLATILRRARVDLVPGQTIRPEPTITLRPSGPVKMVPVARPS